MTKYTKEEINEILNLKGWLNQTIDVFNLYGVLTIGVSSDPHQWEVQQRTHSENILPISLEDFKDCQTEADVKKRFNEVLRKAVLAEMIKTLQNQGEA